MDSRKSSRGKTEESKSKPLGSLTHTHTPKDIISCLQCQACLPLPWKWITFRFRPRHSLYCHIHQPIPISALPPPCEAARFFINKPIQENTYCAQFVSGSCFLLFLFLLRAPTNATTTASSSSSEVPLPVSRNC